MSGIAPAAFHPLQLRRTKHLSTCLNLSAGANSLRANTYTLERFARQALFSASHTWQEVVVAFYYVAAALTTAS